MLNTPELARLLVEAGALEDLHLATSTENLSPVHVAAAVDAVEVVDFLLSAGINVNITHQGNTPLHVAARHGRLKTANLLIKRGADLLARVDSLTPLHIAAHKGHLEMVRLLCENGAEVDALDSQGTTPLFRSLEGTARRLEVAHALVTEFGASIDLRDNEDWTAAHYCARWGYSDLLQLILSRGFNPNAQDVDGWSLLHCAAKGGHAGIVVALLQKGARPDVCDAEDWNALHFACDTSEECVDVVKMLLDCGVDINAQSKVGLTALHLAARWGFLEATKLLLDHGSNPCAVEQGYRTPLHMAT
ncbi:ankyrin repeat-containing domain protein, partial [Cladochytrium replicatum]